MARNKLRKHKNMLGEAMNTVGEPQKRLRDTENILRRHKNNYIRNNLFLIPGVLLVFFHCPD